MMPWDTAERTKRTVAGSELRKGNRGLSANGKRTKEAANIITLQVSFQNKKQHAICFTSYKAGGSSSMVCFVSRI